MEIGNFEELSVVLKLGHKVVAYQPLVPFRGCTTVSWCFNTFFFSFNPSLNFTKFHLNSRVSPQGRENRPQRKNSCMHYYAICCLKSLCRSSFFRNQTDLNNCDCSIFTEVFTSFSSNCYEIPNFQRFARKSVLKILSLHTSYC